MTLLLSASLPARLSLSALALSFALTVGTPTPMALAQDSKVVAKVNGKSITEADLKLAEQELAGELPNVPAETKRQLLVEYMIENVVFADAAEAQKLDKTPDFEARQQYTRRRVLRELYYDTAIKAAVPEADAKKFYDDQVGKMPKEEEVNARHILVEKKELADEIVTKLKANGDFAALAKEHSKDPGSKENGGSLGFFGKGQMVPQFEEAAFKLAKGEVSAPVQSQFGWHVIKLEEKRARQAPPYESLKERIMQSLIGQKAQSIATELRAKAKVEIVDPELNKAMTGPKAVEPKKP